MSEDLSDIINNVKKMMDNGNVPDNVKEMLGNLNTDNTASSNNNNNNNVNIDIGTIMKMKSIVDSMNQKDDPRTNLLYSLKPYLRESRKSKLDQYVNLLNMAKIADVMKNENKGNDKNGYK